MMTDKQKVTENEAPRDFLREKEAMYHFQGSGLSAKLFYQSVPTLDAKSEEIKRLREALSAIRRVTDCEFAAEIAENALEVK